MLTLSLPILATYPITNKMGSVLGGTFDSFAYSYFNFDVLLQRAASPDSSQKIPTMIFGVGMINHLRRVYEVSSFGAPMGEFEASRAKFSF